jgi:hypothetical protein
MTPRTRPVSWIRAALKEFETFPEVGQVDMPGCADNRGRGRKSDIAKPMYGMGSGIFEIALPFRGMPSA